MVAESGRMGPRNIVWLRNKLNPKRVGTNVKTVLDIFGGNIGGGIHAQVKAVETIIAKARGRSTATSRSMTYCWRS
eukprot:1207937-Prymnesium_polylepis.1